jgi:basic membrane lipoprotein Med (substrate-binding protein (PBP1-ABC) superfamily)
MASDSADESFAFALAESETYRFIDGFVAGAKWWEFEKTGFTMWQSDQRSAETVAYRRLAETDPGEIGPENTNRFIAGFIEGAKWWEFYKYDRALKPVDQERAASQASIKLRNLPASYSKR